MATIFTDDFSYSELSVELGDYSAGHVGRDLILTTDSNREFRVTLTNEQLNELTDVLLDNGYAGQGE